jgi:hypothetical protein
MPGAGHGAERGPALTASGPGYCRANATDGALPGLGLTWAPSSLLPPPLPQLPTPFLPPYYSPPLLPLPTLPLPF